MLLTMRQWLPRVFRRMAWRYGSKLSRKMTRAGGINPHSNRKPVSARAMGAKNAGLISQAGRDNVPSICSRIWQAWILPSKTFAQFRRMRGNRWLWCLTPPPRMMRCGDRTHTSECSAWQGNWIPIPRRGGGWKIAGRFPPRFSIAGPMPALKAVAVEAADALERIINWIALHQQVSHLRMQHAMQRTVMKDGASANAGADGQVDEISQHLSGAPALFAHCRRGYVRIDGDWNGGKRLTDGLQEWSLAPTGFWGGSDGAISW